MKTAKWVCLHIHVSFIKRQRWTLNFCYSVPSSLIHRRGAQVHGAHQAASHMPALNLPSRSRYSFTDHLRMEGWVSPGPGCKEQLAHVCYADSNRGPSSPKSSTLTTKLSRHHSIVVLLALMTSPVLSVARVLPKFSCYLNRQIYCQRTSWHFVLISSGSGNGTVPITEWQTVASICPAAASIAYRPNISSLFISNLEQSY